MYINKSLSSKKFTQISLPLISTFLLLVNNLHRRLIRNWLQYFLIKFRLRKIFFSALW